MGKSEKWSVLSSFKRAVQKINFLLKFNKIRWRLASILGNASKMHRRRHLSFNDRLGLQSCIEDEESDGKSKSMRRMRSYGSSDDEDVDKRAEIFIANFRRQLQLERQISLDLRYCRGTSFN